ncbi:AraC family transcriptional regulator [Pseudomaricurvus alkylphenolicus]|uniref:AraC family transcriptional regulator n=1 Tax=Pseudomaricurvus alkylphenolicus TaxID=1306991 RepID=UPI001423961C|nr:AraC family transcriptional regulator [Pseudomaricurvus alkylphenolicus]NIB38976.1 AraC family transcriptional regulator [Pseudomaricurvus alkylphenolicus]
MNVESVPAKYKKALLYQFRKRGVNLTRALSESSYTFEEDDLSLESEESVSLHKYCELLRQYSLCTRGSFFGLPVVGNSATEGFRLMALSVVHCANLGEALQRARDFYRLCGEENWSFQVHQEGDTAAVEFENRTGGQDSLFSVYELAMWFRFWSWISGQYINIDQVSLSDRSPHYEHRYMKLLGGNIHYNQAHTAIHFHSDYLKSALVHNEESIEEFIRTAPYHLVTIPKNQDNSLTEKIRYIIGGDFTKAPPSYERVSEILHVSTTTLRRRLRSEGTTYQQIKDDTRRDAAVDYLGREELSIKDIAYMMGYLDPCAFSRSFKRWTGLPPGVYRRERLGIFEEKLLEA